MTDQTSEVLRRLEKSLDDYTDAVHEHRKNIHEKDYKKCEVCQSKRQDILGQLRTALKDTGLMTPYEGFIRGAMWRGGRRVAELTTHKDIEAAALAWAEAQGCAPKPET